jgi:hypothetical protein
MIAELCEREWIAPPCTTEVPLMALLAPDILHVVLDGL